MAINIIALGVASFLAEALFCRAPRWRPDPVAVARPSADDLGPRPLGVDRVLEDKGWFLVSDLAALLNVVVSQLSLFTLVALVLIFGTGWLLWRTPFGLRLPLVRRVALGRGDLGVNVYRYKFVAVTMSRRSAWVARSSRWWPRPATRTGRPAAEGSSASRR